MKPSRRRRALFQRSEPLFREGEDNVGRVRVYVRLIEPRGGRMVAGNISRTVSIPDSTVSLVMDAIERALFGT